MVNDQAKNLRELVRGMGTFSTSEQSKLITVTSGKGGVGKSYLASTLALALKKRGKDILLIDGNFGLPSLDTLLGTRTRDELELLAQQEITFEEAVTNVTPGLALLSGFRERLDYKDIDLRFILDIKQGYGFDFIIIDTGAGLNDSIFEFVHMGDINLVITTTELTSITDTYALIKSLAGENKATDLYLVVTRCSKEQEAITTWKKLNKVLSHFVNYNIPLLGFVMEDPGIKEGIKKRRADALLREHSPSGIAIKNFAQRFISMQAKCQ